VAIGRALCYLDCGGGNLVLRREKLRLALVVDDSMLIRHTVSRFLEGRGYRVERATNGAEALEMLKTLQPDLILTDIQMPQLSGTELITALKNNPQTANVPIVILSGRPREQGGIDDPRAYFCVHKDIDIEEQLAKAVAALPK
jgi:CheY-like chemotaxis protein